MPVHDRTPFVAHLEELGVEVTLNLGAATLARPPVNERSPLSSAPSAPTAPLRMLNIRRRNTGASTQLTSTTA